MYFVHAPRHESGSFLFLIGSTLSLRFNWQCFEVRLCSDLLGMHSAFEWFHRLIIQIHLLSLGRFSYSIFLLDMSHISFINLVLSNIALLPDTLCLRDLRCSDPHNPHPLFLLVCFLIFKSFYGSCKLYHVGYYI